MQGTTNATRSDVKSVDEFTGATKQKMTVFYELNFLLIASYLVVLENRYDSTIMFVSSRHIECYAL